MFIREHNLRNYAIDKVTTHYISFRDFARWIAFDDYRNKNKHFRPQSYMCPPCKTQYNYVVKVETMNQDASKLMELHQEFKVDQNLFNSTIHNSQGGFGDRSTREMVEMAKKYYKRLDTDVIERLLSIYKHDMLAFGYTFDIRTRTVGGLTL